MAPEDQKRCCGFWDQCGQGSSWVAAHVGMESTSLIPSKTVWWCSKAFKVRTKEGYRAGTTLEMFRQDDAIDASRQGLTLDARLFVIWWMDGIRCFFFFPVKLPHLIGNSYASQII